MRGAAPQGSSSTRPRSGASTKPSDRSSSAKASNSFSPSLLDSEGGSHGATDTVQWTIEQNKQLLANLKQENKELKLDLSRRNAPASAGKSQADKAVEKLEKSVHGLRRQYDKIMQEKKTALSKLSNLQDSIRDLTKAAGQVAQAAPVASKAGTRVSGSGGPATGPAATPLMSREVRQLENRLEKAVLKANEAQSIRGTYEQVLEKLNQEQTGFNSRSRTAEDSIKAAQTEYERLLISSKEAQHAKEQVKQELSAFEEKLRTHRLRWEKQLEEQRTQAQLLQQTNTKLLQRQYPSAQAAEEGDVGSSRPGADQQAEVKNAAQAVRAMCQKAGCSSIRELVSNLVAQQESYNNLTDMRQAAEEQLKELEGDMALARSHLEELHGGGRLTTQSQLDSAQAELREATAKAEDARQLHDQVLRTHADVCSGLDHLASMVAVLPAPPGLPPMAATMGQGNPEQALDMLGHCEQRLVAAHKLISGFPKAVQMLEDMSNNPDLSFSGPASSQKPAT